MFKRLWDWMRGESRRPDPLVKSAMSSLSGELDASERVMGLLFLEAMRWHACGVVVTASEWLAMSPASRRAYEMAGEAWAANQSLEKISELTNPLGYHAARGAVLDDGAASFSLFMEKKRADASASAKTAAQIARN